MFCGSTAGVHDCVISGVFFFKHLVERGISSSEIQRRTCGVKDSTMTNKAKGREIYAGLDRPRMRPPEFLDDHRMKLVRLSALRTGRLYHRGNISGSLLC